MIFQKLQNLKNKNIYLIVFIFNVLLGLLFFIQNLNSGYTDLASDTHNYLPICEKIDDPNLYNHDLYLNDINNVKYYAPFYINTLRFIKHSTQSNYLYASNILFFITHILFGFLWFLLFHKVYDDFWVAFILSILIRGLVWLPGYEIWGISDLWSLMPRTLYAAILPLPFILLFQNKKTLIYLAPLMIGLILNFHPITGIGGILLFYFIIFWLHFNKFYKFKMIQLFYMIIFTLFGMLPYIYTYIQKTEHISYDKILYEQAFLQRISSIFKEPIKYISLWVKIRTLYYLIPILIIILISFTKKIYIKETYLIISTIILLIIIPTSSYYIEHFINSILGTEIKMSFQLIRIQKLAVIPSFFAMGYILKYIFDRFILVSLKFLFFTLFIILLSVSNAKVFDGIPLMGDDVFRTLLPNSLNVFDSKRIYFNEDLEKMLEYIKIETDRNALFYGPSILRIGSKRAVILDTKGASMLLESNPLKFVEWYEDYSEFSNLKAIEDKRLFLKNKGVNYLLTNNNDYSLNLIKKFGIWELYKLD